MTNTIISVFSVFGFVKFVKFIEILVLFFTKYRYKLYYGKKIHVQKISL